MGIVNRTRYYIPGKTIWGAITAILGRKMMKEYNPKIYEDVGNIYEDVGNFIMEHMIFSYFYPSNDKGEVLYPKYTKNGLFFGKNNLKEEEFEKEFITSYVSTGIDKTSKTAEEGSLHEFELLSPSEFIGYLFMDLEAINNKISINDNEKIEIQIEEFFDAIKKIQVGGERNYGFGWLELKDVDEIKNKVNLYDSGISVSLNEDYPSIEKNDEYLALTHVNIEELDLKDVRGDLEPLVGREWNKKGAGQKISNPKICLTPGTKFKSKSPIKIGYFGIWSR